MFQQNRFLKTQLMQIITMAKEATGRFDIMTSCDVTLISGQEERLRAYICYDTETVSPTLYIQDKNLSDEICIIYSCPLYFPFFYEGNDFMFIHKAEEYFCRAVLKAEEDLNSKRRADEEARNNYKATGGYNDDDNFPVDLNEW